MVIALFVENPGKEILALVKGARALGHRVVPRNPRFFGPGQVERDLGMVIIENEDTTQNNEIKEAYESAKIRVVVLDDFDGEEIAAGEPLQELIPSSVRQVAVLERQLQDAGKQLEEVRTINGQLQTQVKELTAQVEALKKAAPATPTTPTTPAPDAKAPDAKAPDAKAPAAEVKDAEPKK